jgi:hypothetical protein
MAKSTQKKFPRHRDDLEQSRLFIEKARELGADKRQSATDRLIGHLAKKAPAPRKK